jgi:23S rRNA (guanosine2251-2'-O)-methyltransferase
MCYTFFININQSINMSNRPVKLGAKDLRTLTEEEGRDISKKIKRKPLFLVLEDVLDTYNVGGFFRLAEAVAAQKLYLCGRTDTPPNPKIMKASVGNYKIVPWVYKKTAALAVKEIKKDYKKVMVVAVEQHAKSRNYGKIKYHYPLAFVFGNENYGLKKSTLKKVDAIAEVPMYGINRSLNVMVAAGIVLYSAVEKAKGNEN